MSSPRQHPGIAAVQKQEDCREFFGGVMQSLDSAFDLLNLRILALDLRILALVDFYGRVRGVIDSRDGEFLNDFDALQRIRELIAAYEATKEECN